MIGFLKGADEWAPLEVCIFNIGANVSFSFVDTTERVFRKEAINQANEPSR